MPDGFKVADAFVDVSMDLDETQLLHDTETASDKAGNLLSRGLEEGGTEGGRRAGESLDRGLGGRIRDMRGRNVKSLGDMGDEGGRRSGLGMAKGLLGGILSGATQGAVKGGKIVTDGLSNVGPAGPIIGGVILAGVGVAAPLAGAALGGALVAGVAAAGIGVGVAAAFRQPAVKGAMMELKNEASDAFDRIGRDWEPTMISVIGNVKGQVRGIGSELQRALAPAKSYVQPLVSGFMGLVRNALPGFNALLAKSGPVIAVLGEGLAEIGDALSDAFADIGGETDGAAAGLQTMVYLVADLIRGGGAVIAWLSDAYATTVDWAVAFFGFITKIPGVGSQFDGLLEDLKAVQATAHGAGPAIDGVGNSLNGLSGATSRASASNEAMAARQRILNGTMAQGADEAGTLKAAMDALNGAAQSAEAAELGYKEALDAARQSIKENGKTLDSNTTKGRANRNALLALAQAGQAHAQAVYDQTAATKGTSAAESAAARAYANSREKLIQTRMAMGDSRAAAVAYANRIMAIPKSWNTKIKADTAAAMNAIRGVRTGLQGIPNSKTVTIAMRVTGHQNASAVAASLRKQGMATGGPVTGPGLKGVDSELRLLAPGEHVLTDKEVDAAGGHQAIQAWRMALRSGVRLSGPASSSGPARSSGSAGQQGAPAGQVYQFGPGSIVLDLSSFRSLQEIMDAVTGLGSASRTFRSSTIVTAGA